MAQQCRGQSAVHRIEVRFVLIESQTELAAGLFQLTVQILPLSDPQIGQKFLSTPSAQFIVAAAVEDVSDVFPQIQQCIEVGIRIIEAFMHLVGLVLFVKRPFARILDRKG